LPDGVTERGSSTGLTASRAAVRLLTRRPLSEDELCRRLEAQGYAAADVASACSRLRQAGYLDDRRLAMDFIVTRAERLGHGPERLVADLLRRGVRAEVARSAMQLAVERGDLAPRELLRARIRSRLGDGPPQLEARGYARMYNALRRAGFDEESIGRELEPYRTVLDSPGERTVDERIDDLP
jgi:SOS response regulatory protein OraA/RecX